MSLSLKKFEFAAPIGNVDAYIHRVSQIPALSVEEEQDYAVQYKEQNDLNAARQLVLSHLRHVVHIAKGYMGYGLALADLIQEGNIGLMKAVKRFDPLVGVRLITFAVHWIKAEIHEFILKNWRIVKVATTKAQRKLFFNLRSAKNKLGWFNQQEAEQMAEDLGVNVATVQEMEGRMTAHDASLEAYGDEEDEGMAPIHFLEDTRYDPAVQVEHLETAERAEHSLQSALAALDARSLDIVNRRWLAEEKATLHDLAAQYQVSPERIRQLEQNAMKKLKLYMAG